MLGNVPVTCEPVGSQQYPLCRIYYRFHFCLHVVNFLIRVFLESIHAFDQALAEHLQVLYSLAVLFDIMKVGLSE